MYACTDERIRRQQFEVLLKRLGGYTEPCLVMGDFNDLLLESEKYGGMVDLWRACERFEILWPMRVYWIWDLNDTLIH